MAVNLLDLATKALGNQVLGQLANSLGESETKTKSAIEVAIPAILGGLMKKASTPQGAQEAFEQAKSFDTGFLDNIGDLISGGGQKKESGGLLSMGAKLLPMLLGSNQDSIIGSIAKLAGIGQSSSRSLLGMIAPLLFGLIAKQVKSGNLDLTRFIDLIMGQKQQVAKNLPGELTKQLGISGLLDQGVAAGREGGRQVSRAAQETADSGMGFVKVLIPLLLVLAGAWAAWKFMFSKPAEEMASRGADVVQGVTNAASEAADSTKRAAEDAVETISESMPAVPNIDLDAISKNLGTSFGDLTKSLSEVTDEASARLALPKITELEKQVNELGWDKMSATNQTTLTGVLQPLIENLKAALDKIYAIPGVKAIIEPAVTALMSKLPGSIKPA